jgi:Predicted RNA-binding protein
MLKEAFAIEETIALAKRKACEILGESEKDVQFEIIQNPQKKRFGLFGGKMAQVRAFLKESKAERAKNYIKEILYYMGMESPDVTIIEEEDTFCTIKISGEGIKYIIGKFGETLNAIQYLAGIAVNNRCKGKYYKIRLEAGDYREKRKKSLLAFVKRTAYTVLKDGKKVDLEPMRAYERKLIHSTIDGIDGVESWSEGKDGERHVVIAKGKSL